MLIDGRKFDVRCWVLLDSKVKKNIMCCWVLLDSKVTHIHTYTHTHTHIYFRYQVHVFENGVPHTSL